MDWTAPIDLYCERLGTGLWAEPLNAISNAAFLVAAGIGFAAWRRQPLANLPVLVLTLLVAAIGVGSFLFHIFANRWSVLADVIPITVFIYGYLALALRRFLGFGWPAAGGILVLFFALNLVLERALSPLLGGSAGYAPALLALAATGTALHIRKHPAARPLLAATGIFLVSLTLRTLDVPLCPALPIGTHFLWHILNATTLAVLLLAATSWNPRTAPARPMA
jgi:hypothetical protein